MFGRYGGNLNDPNRRNSGVVITGCGCSPLGLGLSLILSAVGTLLANFFLRRRQ
jgi:hypothetical protein